MYVCMYVHMYLLVYGQWCRAKNNHGYTLPGVWMRRHRRYGAEVKRHGHEDCGEVWGGVYPSPLTAVPLPRFFFLLLALKIVSFDTFWVVFLQLSCAVYHLRKAEELWCFN